MKEMSIPTTFSIDFVGDLFELNDIISKARVRIYYKGGNRNGTWITSEVAERLNSTLPHVPIVASYNAETGDFEDHADHGNKKAYGFVPTDANLAWVTGDDGKEYLEADVYLWTGYWEEAKKIVNKSQSMELDKKSITGDWKVVNGDIYFVYQSAAFKGLCALGDAVLPCFEEASFYSLDEESRSFFQNLNEINENNPGGEKMNEELLNNVVETESAVEVENQPAEVFSEEVVEDIAEEVFENEASDVQTEEFAEETTETEESAELIGSSQSLTINQSTEEAYRNEDGSVTVIRQDSSDWIRVETYYELQAENAQLKERIAELENENASLGEYKAIVLRSEKEAVVEQFKKKLNEEEISEIVESLDNYSTDELKTKLSVILAGKILEETSNDKSSHQNFVRVPDKKDEGGTVAILRKYKKN